ncbi:MAG TPA: hypothetical protein PKZ32_02835, partial [Candidatus Melainabacteria bacterium]|nr:hypothetical protein [Candidatus Melainabacteria bacterium]
MSKKPIKPGRAAKKASASPAPQRSGPKTPARKRSIEPIPPMLASVAEEPFSKQGWVFEPKFDGIRAIAYVSGANVKILSRRGLDLTSRYPELVESLQQSRNDLV